MIRNIVFDMGMVLMEFHPLKACRAVAPDEAAAQELLAAIFTRPEWPRTDLGTISMEELGALAMASLTDPALRALVPGIIAGMPHNVVTPIPGMAAVVADLAARGFRLYLLSNAGMVFSDHRELVPGIETFSGVIFSALEGLVKPDPAIYTRLTERFELAPEECVFIDDVAKNIQTARELGWQGYVFDGDVAAIRRYFDALPNP